MSASLPVSSAFRDIPRVGIDVLSVAACALWVRNVEAEHEAHQHHIMEENGGKLPEPPAYEYLNRRRKFPCYIRYNRLSL